MAKKASIQGLKTQPVADSDWTETENERRFDTVDDARSIFNDLIVQNSLRSLTFAQTRNQLEGGRPTDPRLLADMGATWQCNVNFGDARAQCERTKRPYWKMVCEVPHKISVTIPSNNPNSDKWEVSFAEVYDMFCDDWGAGFFNEFNNLCSNYVEFGPGIAHWETKDSPRWTSVNVQRILWPKNARMNPDEWEYVSWVQDMSASKLYGYVRTKADRKRSEFVGWNTAAIKKACTYYKTGTFSLDPYDYTRAQDMLVNNDIRVASKGQPLQLVWLLCKEYSGKIGCYVFTRQGGVDEFLFKDEEYADSFRRILGAIWYDTGVDSMIHSIKGFAIKNYDFARIQNQLKSRFMDAATMVLGVNLQRTSENIPDEAPPVENYGPYTVFPSGLAQLNVYPQIAQAESVIAMLDGNQSENNSLYREQSQQISQTDTATQAKILAGLQGEMTEAGAAMYLSQMGENIFSEQVRRLRIRGSTDADAKRFVRRLREREVPDEVIFDQEIVVKTGASAGMANPAVRSLKFRDGLSLSTLPGVNQRWFLENLIANEYGAQAVGKALLPQGAASKPEQRRQAEMENLSLGMGHPLEALASDAHPEHIEEHLKPLIPIAHAAQQGQQLTPEQVSGLTIGIEHTGEHMQFLSKDESQKQAFMALREPFSFVQSVARGVLAQTMKAQQEQQQQPAA